VTAKIEGINIFVKTQQGLKDNKPKLLLPMMIKVQGQRSLGIIKYYLTYEKLSNFVFFILGSQLKPLSIESCDYKHKISS
jgi:hypothetical protein